MCCLILQPLEGAAHQATYGCDAGHVIPGLIHKCYLAQKAGEPFTIMGTGKPL